LVNGEYETAVTKVSQALGVKEAEKLPVGKSDEIRLGKITITP